MKLFLPVLLALLLVPSAGTVQAESKMSLSVAGDVLIPMGDFGDTLSTGFGGSVRFQYEVTPAASVGLTSGYYTWSGKDGEGVTAPGSTKGIPIRAFGKYYFMPKDEKKLRVYGILELGIFIATVDVPSYESLGQTYGGSETSTDFNWAPGLGVEVPLGGGRTALDISARYDAISAEGHTNGSLAVRVGVNFMLGN